MKSFLTLTSVEDVLAHIRTFSPLAAETVPLGEAAGRWLAEDWYAPEDLPGFDRSTVDGWAVHARDVFGASEGAPALLECAADLSMGKMPDAPLEEGYAARIFTGGMLPEGADSVVMVEHSRPVSDTLVELVRSQAPGDHVIFRDDDAAKGALLIPSGRCLRPQEIGLLAALGQVEVPVRRRPRVVIVSTGDELVPCHEKPAPGQVRDVNSHSLAAFCRAAGAEVELAGLVRDDIALLRETIARACEKADVVLVSGGSSAGMRDHTVDIFTSMPESELLVHGVAISPGKPFILAKAGKPDRSGQVCLMGLPGHVGAALITARAFLRPLLLQLQGGEERFRPGVRARLTRPMASAQGRRDYIRVRLSRTEEGWAADPILLPSGLMSGLVHADAIVICPENSEGLYAGEEVWAEILTWA